MGCSSSSAQTVEQEKRPGTKPEESNGDTVAVKNGIITEDVQTIEDQMLLPVQTALPDDLKAGPEDETETVLVAMEAQEDLGSGEDLLASAGPQSEPAASEELEQQPASSAAVEDSVEPDVAAAVTEVAPPAEEALPVETLPEVVAPEAKALDATEETPDAKSDEAVQTEVPVLADEVPSVPVAEPVIEMQAGTTEVVIEAADEAAFKASTGDAEPVQAETSTGNTAPETVSETPEAGEASTAATISVAHEAAALGEPSGPADTVEPVIDTAIAAASVPEMTPVPPAMAQGKPDSAPEEETEVSTASAVTAPSAEAFSPMEVPTAPEPAKTSEAAPVTVTAEVPEVKPIMTQSEALSDSEPATEPVPEPSPEAASGNEASKDAADEIAKKED